MINDKQIELSRMIFDTLKNKFPEIELVNIVESSENPNTIWVRVTVPPDDNKEIELLEIGGEMSADILLDYGYHILVILTSASTVEKKSA